MAFVDLTKALDLVKRTKLWDVLIRTGVKGKLFKTLQGMYKTVKACVRTTEGLTDYFDCPSGIKQGCTASPILFSILIDEFSGIVENSGIRGVQLFHELTEILLLMFADDLALISDTVSGLQKLLYLLYEFCNDKGLIVNIAKTVIVVFKKSGGLARNEFWTLGGVRLKVESSFTYVGVNFTTRQLSLIQMAKDQAIKGKRVLISVSSKLYQYGQLTKGVFFKIFDTKICPVLLYGAEIWGIEKQLAIERIQYYACKRNMCVQSNSCNDAVLGDCGRYPMYIQAMKRSISYWSKILKMRENKYARKCYNMMYHYDQLRYINWASHIRKLLHTNGFGYIRDSQEVNNEKNLLYVFQQRLKDQYLQTWYAAISLNSNLSMYAEFKRAYIHEPYLNVVTIRKYRRALASFRTSSHRLQVERGRHLNIPRNERKCAVCQTSMKILYGISPCSYIMHFNAETFFTKHSRGVNTLYVIVCICFACYGLVA